MSTKTIDVKGLEHSQKEKLIFPSLWDLQAGDSLRIVVEFNPLPLTHLLRAQGGFDFAYEKEGPEEWVLRITRTNHHGEEKESFKALLKELKEGEVSPQTRQKAKDLLQSVDAKTLGIVEQELIQEGIGREVIRRNLCDIHLEVLRDTLVSQKREVTAPHPVHTLMEEHKVIIGNLRELDGLARRLEEVRDFESMGEDLENLKEIAHHLVEAESHHQREEEALFPWLEKHGITEPPAIMKEDHEDFRKRKRELYQISQNPRDYDFHRFKTRVAELAAFLVKELDSHIFKEDHIIYQVALQVLSPEEWEKVKRQCDKIGYCCFTPEDQKPAAEVVELDLRPMPPWERHEKIFQTWDTLKPGQSLRIINDHDPKPLRYQFEAEHKGKYRWHYEESGPRDWKVKIQRI